MTKQNLNAKAFLLSPCGKDYIWGGNRLNDNFSKNIDMKPLAETWECSTHPDGLSMVASGEYTGKSLKEVLENHPEYLGTNLKGLKDLPILIKFIDAKKDLSVQVHPDDEYAIKNENSLGKSEMWYVLDAQKDTKLVYGFKRDVSPNLIKESIEDGTVEKYLQKIPIKKDDVFYLEAGTVHAIGAGALIVEVQENSNLTYRLYDYNRKDKNGQKRPLHIEKVLEVANFKASQMPKQPIRILKYKKGTASEFLCRCKYFHVERMLINTQRCRDCSEFSSLETSFQVFLCLNGCGVLIDEEENFINFFKGDCIFIPANAKNFKIHGMAQFLKITC